jgi:hypothetical protein
VCSSSKEQVYYNSSNTAEDDKMYSSDKGKEIVCPLSDSEEERCGGKDIEEKELTRQ